MNAPLSSSLSPSAQSEKSFFNTLIMRWDQFYAYWEKQAYRHKSAEKLMYLMFVSGFLLWDQLAVSWMIERWLLLAHMMVGISVFLWVVGVFWSAHRRLLLRSKKAFLRITGRMTEGLLVLCISSGIYLFFYGVTGNELSLLIQDVHFYSSVVLTPLVFRHAFRWSVLNLKSSRLMAWLVKRNSAGGSA